MIFFFTHTYALDPFLLFYLASSLYVSLSLFLYIFLSIFLLLYLSPSLSLSFHLYLSPSLSLFLSLFPWLFSFPFSRCFFEKAKLLSKARVRSWTEEMRCILAIRVLKTCVCDGWLFGVSWNQTVYVDLRKRNLTGFFHKFLILGFSYSWWRWRDNGNITYFLLMKRRHNVELLLVFHLIPIHTHFTPSNKKEDVDFQPEL